VPALGGSVTTWFVAGAVKGTALVMAEPLPASTAASTV